MRGYYSDPTANQAIVNIEREKKREEQRKKREKEKLYREVQRIKPSPYKKEKDEKPRKP
ncbi:MAG: hypothetical protein ACOX54_07195 [Christensenellales bacterium]|jgi:hypothetical protein